jgi:hypothetical protein
MSERDKPNDAASGDLPSRRFEGREDFRQLVRDALATAAREGWRELVLCDATFADWPLGERVVVESLQSWSKSGRQVTLLAKRYDDVVRMHPRFVQWRGKWSHIITAVACPSADPLELPSAIMSPAWVLERRDIERSNGYCGSEPERRVALRESLAEWLRQATPAFPATTLGL